MPLGDTIPSPVIDGTVYISEIEVKSDLFKSKSIVDFDIASERNKEFESPHDPVKVMLIKSFKHTVGKNTYEYEAMKSTVVPRHIAERLNELGLLYVGGIDSLSLKRMIDKPDKKKDWTIKVPRG
jgi:putative NADH-flavin reductase